jgi:hypothetical protein
VSIQTGCSNVHVKNVVCNPGHGIRFVVSVQFCAQFKKKKKKKKKKTIMF